MQLISGADVVYKPKKLNEPEALELFSQYAFKTNQPTRDYDRLSRLAIQHAHGVPLALKVLGALLDDRSVLEWEDVLKKTKKTQLMGIQDVIRKSFDGLDDSEKDIFLDIACFFKGMEKDYVTKILDSCGFYPHSGLGVLINRTLITISDYDTLKKHDLLQNMGWEIVHQESNKDLGRQSSCITSEDAEFVSLYTNRAEVQTKAWRSLKNHHENPEVELRVSLTNVSPWITTVGDRDFPATVKLGNGRTITGVSLYRGRMKLSTNKQYPVVYLGSNSTIHNPSSLSLEGTLDRQVVAGKIVICDRGISPRVQKGEVVKKAGGVGMILANTAANGEELVADCHLVPAVAVGENEAKGIKHYASTSPRATATLTFLGTRVGVRPSPVVAAFSSRGPNLVSLDILKPDMVAPGVNIIAAWTGGLGPSSLPADRRRVKFNILSGTSMSCPHVSGIAALLKARHPDWSPAAIKSALMTTAYVHDNTRKPLQDSSAASISTPYDHGAGHINPVRALDLGLIYDIEAQDYLEFLCTQRLTPTQLKVFTKYSNRSCKNNLASPGELNYPALSVVFPERTNVSVLTLHRTVTNVGPAVSNYHAIVSPFKGAYVKVEPRTLKFTKANQKLSYKIIFTTKSRQAVPEFGGLVWKDGVHRVRSPIVVVWLPPL
ncbi:hypothetical protein COP2_001901 [Malus domestica]